LEGGGERGSQGTKKGREKSQKKNGQSTLEHGGKSPEENERKKSEQGRFLGLLMVRKKKKKDGKVATTGENTKLEIIV